MSDSFFFPSPSLTYSPNEGRRTQTQVERIEGKCHAMPVSDKMEAWYSFHDEEESSLSLEEK